MKEGFAVFNPMADLSDEERAAVLREAFNDPDPSVFVVALSALVRARGVADVAESATTNTFVV